MKVDAWVIATFILGFMCLLLLWEVITLDDELYRYDAYLDWYESDVERYSAECEQAIQTNLDTATLWMDRYYECVEASYG